jgi:hypothetical protein
MVCRRRRSPADLDIVRYWDLAATEKTELNTQIDVGVKPGRDKNGGYWLLDVVWARPTRAMSSGCCSTPHGRQTGRGRVRQDPGRPARARRSIWFER